MQNKQHGRAQEEQKGKIKFNPNILKAYIYFDQKQKEENKFRSRQEFLEQIEAINELINKNQGVLLFSNLCIILDEFFSHLFFYIIFHHHDSLVYFVLELSQ